MTTLHKSDISIVAWNICGAKCKINDPDFIAFLEPHDVIILTETFSQEDSIQVDGYKAKNVFLGKC